MRDDRNADGDQPTAPPAQQHTDALNNWPRLPDGVAVADGINLDLPDPTYVPEIVHAGNDRNSHRRCVAARQDGARCASRAMHHSLTCPLHGGRLRPEDGGKARVARREQREAAVEQALQLQRLGTRAVVAETLVEEAANVRLAVKLLCQSAGSGDLAAAEALIPWLDQALGKPTERVEHRTPTGLEDLEFMSTEELTRIVAQGRAKRLERMESERKDDEDSDVPG